MPIALYHFDNPSAAVEAAARPRAAVLGGGTLLVRNANMGNTHVNTFVRLRDSDWNCIHVGDDRITLGAGVTMAGIIGTPALQWLAPAARAVGGPAVRNMATVGGNLFAESPFGDFAVALLALNTLVEVATSAGTQQMPIEDFFAARAAGHQMLVRRVSFSKAPGSEFRYLKVSRVKPKRLAVMTIAVVLEEQGSKISAARIALGAMAATPIRAKAAEAALLGSSLTQEGVKATLERCLDEVQPADDPVSSAWYRSTVLPIHLRRLLLAPQEAV